MASQLEEQQPEAAPALRLIRRRRRDVDGRGAVLGYDAHDQETFLVLMATGASAKDVAEVTRILYSRAGVGAEGVDWEAPSLSTLNSARAALGARVGHAPRARARFVDAAAE